MKSKEQQVVNLYLDYWKILIEKTEDHQELTRIKPIGLNMIAVGRTISKAADDRSMILYRQGIKTGLNQPTNE
jgi:hypothetical protein